MSTHPLLESAPSTLLEARSNSSNLSTADDEEQQQESNDEGASEGEEEDDFINLPIKKFIPDYERISYGYDAVNKIFKGEDDGGFDDFIGNRLVHSRAKEVIKKMNRRGQYVKNEKHVMLKSLKKCMKKALERKKTKKRMAVPNDPNDSSNDSAEKEDDNGHTDFILSQEESNTCNPDDELILSQGSEFLIDPSAPSCPSSPSISSTSPPSINTSFSSLSNQPTTTSTSFSTTPSISSINNLSSSYPHAFSNTSSSSFQQEETQTPTTLFSTSTSSLSSLPNHNNQNKNIQTRTTTNGRQLPRSVQRNIDGTAVVQKRKRKDSERSSSCKCCFPRCENKSNTKKKDKMIKFTRVPPKPKDLIITSSTRPAKIRRHYKTLFKFQLILKRLGLKKDDDIVNKRYCNMHETETVIEKKKVQVKGVDEMITFHFDNVPTCAGVSNQPRTFSVYDQMSIEKWNKEKEKEIADHGETSGQRINHYKTAFFSMISPTELQRKHGINQTVADHIGLNNRHQFSPSLLSPPAKDLKKHQIKSSISDFKALTSNKNVEKSRKRRKRTSSPLPDPVVKPNQKQSEIKRRTGFSSEKAMFCYILVVCNGDLTLMLETSSNELTWYEEWFLFFEMIWHRSASRWIDISQAYKFPRVHILRKVFDKKAYLVKCCRASWPTYVSFEEDNKLRKSKWNGKYKGKRVVM